MWFAGITAVGGFLIVSPLISLTATLYAFALQRRNGELSEAEGIVALNWQLTYFALQLMLVPLHLALVTVQRATGQTWALLTISAMLLTGTLNLVFSVVCGIRAGRGQPTRLFLAIPFIPKPPERR
jgi:uncharacterized Tic20 family protein